MAGGCFSPYKISITPTLAIIRLNKSGFREENDVVSKKEMKNALG